MDSIDMIPVTFADPSVTLDLDAYVDRFDPEAQCLAAQYQSVLLEVLSSWFDCSFIVDVLEYWNLRFVFMGRSIQDVVQYLYTIDYSSVFFQYSVGIGVHVLGTRVPKLILCHYGSVGFADDLVTYRAVYGYLIDTALPDIYIPHSIASNTVTMLGLCHEASYQINRGSG